MTSTPADVTRLEAAARRALEALADLILDSPDPGVEALGAQYELRQLLFGLPLELPVARFWQIECRRRNGAWTSYSAPTEDEADAHKDFAETVAEHGHRWAYRLVCTTTTRLVEARHEPEPDDEPAASPAG